VAPFGPAHLRYPLRPSTHCERTTVGFLDDLKQQADAALANQARDNGSLQRNTDLTEAACVSVSRYFTTLVGQLNVLQPVSPARFALDRRTAFDGLKMTTFRADARRKGPAGQQTHDHVVLHWLLPTGQVLDLERDFLPDIETLESRLKQSGARLHTEAVRNPDNGKLKLMRYRVHADFAGSVKVLPDHANARLQFQLINLDGFETVNAEFSALAVNSALLDELARWLVGQSHTFLSRGEGVRRFPA
jgi:hypothetical protein